MITENNLIEVILEEFNNLSEEELNSNAKLIDVLGWSSLNILIIRAKIEEEFKVKLTDKDIKSCATIKDLYNKINTK